VKDVKRGKMGRWSSYKRKGCENGLVREALAHAASKDRAGGDWYSSKALDSSGDSHRTGGEQGRYCHGHDTEERPWHDMTYDRIRFRTAESNIVPFGQVLLCRRRFRHI
jgi:hypothetical protein